MTSLAGGWIRTGALLAALALGLALPAGAQVLQLGPWGGELRTIFEYTREDTKGEGASRARSESQRLEERLTLWNREVYVLDPRILSLSLEGTFGLSQEWFYETGSGRDFGDGSVWGYRLSADVLSAQPIWLQLFADRDQNVVATAYGGFTEYDRENRGIRFFAPHLYIPSTLTARQEIRKQETRFGSTKSGFKEDWTIVTYEGRRGWEDAEMDARYEFTDLAGDYQQHEASNRYSLDFGGELNWRWDSWVRAFRRTGGDENDLTSVNAYESLRIDHTEWLQSAYSYGFSYDSRPDGDITTHLARLLVLHRLYQSLTTIASVEGSYRDLPGGREEALTGHVDLEYHKRLPGGGSVSGHLGGGLAYVDQKFTSGTSFAPNEIHTVATPFALPIQLRNPFVDQTSVVVNKVRLGPLPPGCIPPPSPPILLVLGQDYTLRTVGDLTEIVPIPCSGSTPGLNPGDTISVEYRFEVPASLEYTTSRWRAGAELSYPWFRVFVEHNDSNQHRLSGEDGRYLEDRRTERVGAEARYSGEQLTTSLLGQASRVRSSRSGASYDELEAIQSSYLRLPFDLQLNLDLRATKTDFTDQDRETRTFVGRLSATYYPAGWGLQAEAGTGLRWYEDNTMPDEWTTAGYLRLTWRFRYLEVVSSFEIFDTHRSDRDQQEYRGRLELIRRF